MMNLMKDLNILTNIPEKSLCKLASLSVDSICTGVWEDKSSDVNVTEVDIGIGILHIKHEGTDVKYHFEPSDDLRKSLKNALQSDDAPIMPKLLSSLKSKFTEVYKEIC